MSTIFPFFCAISCAVVGMYWKYRKSRRAKLLSAAEETAREILFLLKSGCFSTTEILSQTAHTKSGQTLSCLSKTLVDYESGGDLYAAWKENAGSFCEENSLSHRDRALILQLLLLLGSMELSRQIAAYESLADSLAKEKEEAKQKNSVEGNAAVTVGLLCGLGLRLLFWQP